MEIKFNSLNYKVKKVNKKSKARYAKGLKVGDIIRFEMELSYTTGASNGNYAIYFEMWVNGKFITNLSQNEVPKVAEIFELSEIK